MSASMQTMRWGFARRFFNKTAAFRLKTYRTYAKTETSGGDVTVEIGDRPMTISTGKLARFADGAAVAQHGNTSVLVTAVGSSRAVERGSFVPLTVDYRQKAAAAGRIPTNYLRRELGSTEKEILTSRMIDRSLRPMFPKGYTCETQIMCNLMAVDGENYPDIISINAASAALAVSNIPWNGPIGAVRVGLIDDKFVLNPTRKQQQKSMLDLVVAGVEGKKVIMLEASAENVQYSSILGAVNTAVKVTDEIICVIKDLAKRYGKEKRPVEPPPSAESDVVEEMKRLAESRLSEVFHDTSHDKISRDIAVNVIRQNVLQKTREIFPCVDPALLSDTVSGIIRDVFRRQILDEEIRCDGRKLNDMRLISCDVDLHKPLHGSALFQRGQTQVLCTVSFDSKESAAKTDAVSVLTGAFEEKNFMLHYEFPPYATNEAKRSAGYNRRELGHGNLAERGIRPVVPKDFPFTIRLTSEVLESNGSSSMASVCGGSLALMDAGVPLCQPVAGVAMGLVSKQDDLKEYKVLTDLLGIEDYMGDMDFKVAGTKSGITALQADVKISGITSAIIDRTLANAHAAKKNILAIMGKTISEPRKSEKTCGPVTETVEVPIHRRARFIGVGGRNIRKLKATAGVTVTSVDDSKFEIFAPNKEAMEEAQEMIKDFLEQEPEPTLDFGAIYTGKITEIRESGVMVQLHPRMMPTFLHNSQLDLRQISHPSALGLEVGNEISVKYFGRDPATGNVRLSRKVLQITSSPVSKNFHEPVEK